MQKTNKTQCKITEDQYKFASARVEELMHEVHGDTPASDPKCIELSLMADIVAEYEDAHYSIGKPTIAELIAEALDDMVFSQKLVRTHRHKSFQNQRIHIRQGRANTKS